MFNRQIIVYACFPVPVYHYLIGIKVYGTAKVTGTVRCYPGIIIHTEHTACSVHINGPAVFLGKIAHYLSVGKLYISLGFGIYGAAVFCGTVSYGKVSQINS